MNILDVDLDFFLNEIKYDASSNDRLDDSEFIPWTKEQLRVYLEEICGLKTNDRIKGEIVTYHHEVFECMQELVENGKIQTPVNWYHIDAHADLGMGDYAYIYVRQELLRCNIHERCSAVNESKELKEGNYLLFVIACRWIEELTYVRHDWLRNLDIPYYMYENPSVRGNRLRLTRLAEASTRCEEEFLTREPEIRFNVIDQRTKMDHISFDYLFVAQSPGYTPKSSDGLLKVFEEYIKSM
jgi:hypothetical protein